MDGLNTKTVFVALVLAHAAGMIDMAALPIWVGTLIASYGLAPSVAGGMVTLFLGGIVLGSLAASVALPHLRLRVVAPLAYLVSAAGFVAMAMTASSGTLAALHLGAGVATGLGLSATHAAMGKSADPMKLWGWGGAALGMGAILFLGGAPLAIDAFGRQAVFYLLAAVIGFAALVCVALFPDFRVEKHHHHSGARLGARVWYAAFGIVFMSMLQAMMFSFFERIGMDRGFGQDLVRLTLLLVGVVNMAPGIIAAMLQSRLPAMGVAVAGAGVQAVLGFVVARATGEPLYMVSALLFPPAMMFTHTFVFGYLSRIEPSGRAIAATPAMIMTGSSVGPFLGGVLVETVGYAGLSLASLCVGVVTVSLFTLSARAGRRVAASA